MKTAKKKKHAPQVVDHDPLLPYALIYTDGGCWPNPGRGGYAAIIRMGGNEEEVSGGFEETTNNRMELMAVIAGLEELPIRCNVTVVSDSQYVVHAMELGWVRKWAAAGWRKAKNPDLWQRLLAAAGRHLVRFEWVRGHNGDELNERCDQLAEEAKQLDGLPRDMGLGYMI